MKKIEIRFTFLWLLCAGVTTLVGVIALFGWIFKVAYLIQLTPLAFMQANTALCFVFSGFALFAVNRPHFHTGPAPAILVLIFSGLTLCEYLFQMNLGIDELLFKDFIFSGASHPNRMAPNTALCFFLFATSLLIFFYSPRTSLGNLFTAVLGAVVFVLASIALFGFLVGLEEAFGWGGMTRMSPQTALTFLVAALGMICLAWSNAVRLERGFPVWSATFASVLVVTIFIAIWQSLVIGERQFFKADIKLKHAAMVSRMSFELKDRTLALQRMGRRFEVNFSKDNYRFEWEADVVNYLNHFVNFESIGWVDSAYRAQWVVASDGSRGNYGKSLMDDARLAPVLNDARESRETHITPIWDTTQHEKIFSILVPLFEGEEFLGLIQGKLALDDFLANIFTDGKPEIQMSIYQNGELIFFREAGKTADSEYWVISSTLEFKGIRWLIRCIPSEAYLSKIRSVKPEVVAFFGLVLAWALGAAIQSAQKAKEHDEKLIAANLKLEEEYTKGLEQSHALALSKQKYQTLFNQVKSIIEEVSCESGKKLYALLVQNLAISLGFKFCFVGELDPLDDTKMKTLALWSGSDFSENVTYDLAGTPCENVVGKDLCVHSGKVWKMFPDDKMLRDLNIESYVGTQLSDSSNNPLGILCAMHDEPIADFSNAKLILPLFANIAQSEMERRIYERELQREGERVQVSRDIALAANNFLESGKTLEFALQRLCRFMEWPVGHIYLKEGANKNLVPTRLWHFEDPSKYQTLKAVTEETTFIAGEGLPGRVLASQRPAWIRDVYADPNFPRAKKTNQLGIGSALACPIIIRKEVVGVMEFFTPQILEMDGEVLDLVEQVAVQVARVLERNQAEELLRQQAQVLDQIHDAVISLDTEYNITAWNKGAERVFGFVEDEMLGKPITYLFPGNDKALIGSLIQPTIINNRYEAEMEMFKKCGSFIYAHISLSALCDQNCLLKSIILYVLDITEKKHAKEQLELYSLNLEKRVEQRTAELEASLEKIKNSRDQTEGILKSIGEGLIVMDLSKKIVLMNSTAEKILGVRIEDALGKEVDGVILNQELLSHMRCGEGTGKLFDFELEEESASARRKTIQGVSSLIYGDGGNFVGSVTVLRDVTFERKVDNLKSQFLSTAAHELRTPLTTLQGFSEILLNKKNLPEESVRRYLKYINEESLRLGKIINSFLDISRIESGKGIFLDKTLCSVCGTIERSMHVFDEQLGAPHKFELICPVQTMEWNVDEDKVEQVFNNIYSNAIKYSPNGGKVTTTVKAISGAVEVVVEDEGAGMDEEQMSHIFDRFYRGGNVEGNVPGSGLGMTIVKYILEAHGGNVKVESEPGHGTRVIMNIPV